MITRTDGGHVIGVRHLAFAVALSMLLLAPCLRADPIALGVNMDFEDPLEWNSAGLGGGGGNLYTWRSDGTAFTSLGPAGANPIVPYHGNFMMQYTYDIDPRCSNCDMVQDVDLLGYTNSIAGSNATFHLDFRYNRIAELLPPPFAPIVQTMIFYKMLFLDTNDNVVANFGPEPNVGEAPIADGDPTTWELATLDGTVPASAEKAEIRISWHCNVVCEGNVGHLYGHFVDDAHFSLELPSSEPAGPPTGLMLNVR